MIYGGNFLRAVAYIRISQEGESPENQRLAINRWAEEKGFEIQGYFIDKFISGAIPPRERPQYISMLNFCKDNAIDIIIFYDVSRLGRNLEETLYELKRLIEEGYNVYFVYPDFLNKINDPMMRKFIVSMFAWFAELYRYDIIQRTKEGMLRAKLQGKRIGRPPKKIDMKKVEELREKGVSLRDIARIMNVGYSTLLRKIKSA